MEPYNSYISIFNSINKQLSSERIYRMTMCYRIFMLAIAMIGSMIIWLGILFSQHNRTVIKYLLIGMVLCLVILSGLISRTIANILLSKSREHLDLKRIAIIKQAYTNNVDIRIKPAINTSVIKKESDMGSIHELYQQYLSNN